MSDEQEKEIADYRKLLAELHILCHGTRQTPEGHLFVHQELAKALEGFLWMEDEVSRYGYEAELLLELSTKVENQLALLRLAGETIEGLADQQAMPDDWYKEPLAKIREHIYGN